MASIKEKEEDPFTRRKCMPRLVTFVSTCTCTWNYLIIYYLDGLCIMHHLNLEFFGYYEAMEAACRPLQVHIVVMHSNVVLLQKMPKKYQGERDWGGGGENERRERERVKSIEDLVLLQAKDGAGVDVTDGGGTDSAAVPLTDTKKPNDTNGSTNQVTSTTE